MIVNICLLIPCMLLGFLYPHVGSILGYTGASIGLLMMYIIPIGIYLKRLHLEVRYPELVRALDKGQITIVTSPTSH